MRALCAHLENAESFDPQELSVYVKSWIGEQGVGFGKVMQPLRLCLVGASRGPDIFEIAHLLGKEETCARLNYAIETLG